MELNYLLFCETAAVTKDGRNVIHGIFNRAAAPQFPLSMPMLTVVYEIIDPPNGKVIDLTVRHQESGEEVLKQSAPVVLSPGTDRVANIIQVFGFKMPGAGRYIASVAIDGETLGKTVLDVTNA